MILTLILKYIYSINIYSLLPSNTHTRYLFIITYSRMDTV